MISPAILVLLILTVAHVVVPHTSPPAAIDISKPATPEYPPHKAESCPAPNEATLRCIRQWACQQLIRLDLRCLLNLNGNPLLGGLVGNAPGADSGDGGGGILGNLLGIGG